jgi:RNA polymerase sigma factor (sigma-70 family)
MTSTLLIERDYATLERPVKARFRGIMRRRGQQSFYDVDELADDLYQDVWTRLHQRLSNPEAKPLEINSDAVAYLASAMYKRFVSDEQVEGRSVRTDRAMALEDAHEDHLASSFDAEHQAMLNADLRAITEAVESLPERERHAFSVLWLCEGSWQDVAKQLGVSLRIAKKLCHEANEKIDVALARIGAGRWCDQWESTIKAVHIGWHVSDARRDALEKHLEHCAVCGATVKRLRYMAAITPPLPLLLAHGALGGLFGRVTEIFGSGRATVARHVLRHSATSETTTRALGAGGTGAIVSAKAIVATCLTGVAVAGGGYACLRAAGVPINIASLFGKPHVVAHSRRHAFATAETSVLAQHTVQLANPFDRTATTGGVSGHSRARQTTTDFPVDGPSSSTPREFARSPVAAAASATSPPAATGSQSGPGSSGQSGGGAPAEFGPQGSPPSAPRAPRASPSGSTASEFKTSSAPVPRP